MIALVLLGLFVIVVSYCVFSKKKSNKEPDKINVKKALVTVVRGEETWKIEFPGQYLGRFIHNEPVYYTADVAFDRWRKKNTLWVGGNCYIGTSTVTSISVEYVDHVIEIPD